MDVKETTLYFLQFILQMDRKCFEKADVEKSLKEMLPSIQEYCEGRQGAERVEGLREDD